MVVANDLQHIFKDICKSPTLTLPKYKPSGMKIEYDNAEVIDTVFSDKPPILPFASSDVFYANIECYRRLTAEDGDCKPVYEMTFGITGQNYEFFTGDTIGIIPHNSDSEVDIIIKHLGIEKLAGLAYTVSVDIHQKGTKIPPHIPVKSTVRYVLKHCVDIRCVVKKLFLLTLSKYTTNENEKKVLEFLCSKEGSTMYNTHVLNKNLCLLDIFTIFKSCKPPVEILLGNLPRLLPRPYSIINSMERNPNVLKICFSVMDTGNHRKGITTGWLEGIIKKLNIVDKMKNLNIASENESVDYKIPMYVRKNINGFNISQHIASNLILVGPGTGVSTFIGLLEERRAFIKESPSKLSTEAWLFFGCRNPKLDFIYEKELKGFVSDNSLYKLCTTFSRVDNSGIKYVQDAILQHGKDIVRLIEQGAVIIVCGDVKRMATQVRDIIIQCLKKYYNQSQEDAETLMTQLENTKRYYVDLWN